MSKPRKKKIQELRRDIEALTKGMTRAATAKEWDDINAADLYERELLVEDLRILETQELEAQARPFGINLYPIIQTIGDPALWENTSNGRRVLTEAGLTRAKNLIVDARFSYWKRWVEIVTPVASTIVSILALLIAILALYLQISSDPIIVLPSH